VEDKKTDANVQPQLMITVSDNVEADRITAALEDEGIPVVREYSRNMQASTVLMGKAVGEIRLLVPAGEEARAREILIGIGALEQEETDELPQEELPQKKVSGFWIMVLVLLLVTLAVFGTDAIVGLFQGVFAK